MALNITQSTIEDLKQQVTGDVLIVDDADYETARLTWNRSTNQFPAVIVVASNPDDVIAAVNFARENSMGIAVQSTGHGTQRPADNALLIITSRMTGVEINAEAQTATVEAGVKWQGVVDKCLLHGLAPLLGTSPNVGVIGYTLGGGIGWLARRYGLAVDSVRSLDIVTPDGVLRHVSATENSDLFFGVCGGGGNFGVVTAMSFDLYSISKLYGGFLTYPAEKAGDALRFYRDWTQDVPEELTSSITVMKYPPLPQLPEAMRGKVEVILRAAYCGDDSAQGQQLIQRWLDWQTPNQNTFREMPFAEVATISNDPVDPVPAFGSNELFSELSDEVIDIVVNTMTNPAIPLTASEFRHAGGAVTRIVGDNAISNRDALFYFQTMGIVPTPEIKMGVKSHMEQYRGALHPYIQGGVFLNFTKTSEENNRVQQAFSPEVFQRLVELKSKYDPDNLFCYSYLLVPSEG